MPPANKSSLILRDAAHNEWLHFEHPLRVVSVSALDEVVPALKEVENAVEKEGWHAAGFISYEAAPTFDKALRTHPPADSFPLLWFGLYPAPRRTKDLPPAEGDTRFEVWTPSITRPAYDQGIARIKESIARGDTYQVNYTFRLTGRLAGSPWSLFRRMIATDRVGYPAFIDTGRHVLCCASPELFFQRDGDQVTCRPMKGTARRGRTLAEDQAQADALHHSPKQRAENVMIVDMLRNDLGRLARTGSVQVTALFSVERYRTLWQMTSTVTAEIPASLTEILSVLFPCASITGAPKVSTTGIIAALESTPRKAYTGTIGFLAPGRQAQFNVAIRTVIVDRQTGQAEYGVGGGVVWDSTPAGEYAEALLKARVLTEPQPPPFALLETLRWTPAEGYLLREKHLQRLRDSAAYFDYPFDNTAVETRLQELAASFETATRVRLLLAADGSLTHEVFPLKRENKVLHVKLAIAPVDSADVFLFHKTTQRAIYEQARAEQPGADDILLYNERSELTESTVANLVVELDGQLYTPPVGCGLLAGTFRANLIEQGAVKERVLLREDLPRCTKLFLVNSVRGWMEVELI